MFIVNNYNVVKVKENSFRNIAIFVNLFILFLLLTCIFFYDNFDINLSNISYFFSLFSSIVFVWIFWSWCKINRNLLDPFSIFLLAAIFFNGGHLLLEALHLNEYGILRGKFSDQATVHTMWLVVAGLLMFHFGGVLATFKLRSLPTGTYHKIDGKDHVKVAVFLLLISIYPTFVVMRDAVATVYSGGYLSLYAKESALGLSASSKILSNFLVPSGLLFLAGSNQSKFYIRLSIIIVFGYSLLQFFLGYRGWATMPLIGFFWLWHSTIRPLPKRKILIAAMILLFIIFPLIKETRAFSSTEKFNFTNIYNSIIKENVLVLTIEEMGTSMRTIAHTIHLVPETRDFEMGKGYLYAFLAIVPNVWEGVHPAVAHGSPSNWLTWEVEPIIAESGGGIGYSFIAESYLNFGWYGSLIFLTFLGYLYARFVLWATRSESNAKKAMLACFISFSLYFARGEMSNIFRQLIWYSLLPYLLVVILSIRSKQNRPRIDLK